MTNRSALREQIIPLLRDGNFSALVALAGREEGVAGQLLLFLYDPTSLLHWRAVEGLGNVAGAHPQQVEKLIGRLLYQLNEDSGSFGWGAAAALGEIARHRLSLMTEIIPMFYGFLEQDFSRASMLWGVGRLGEAHPELLEEIVPLILSFLGHADPQLRGLSAWCLGKMRHQPAAAALETLLADDTQVQIYDRGEIHRATVGRVAQAALAALGTGEASR